MNQSPEQLPFFLGSRLVKELDLGVGGNLYGGRMLDFTAEQAAIHAARCTGESHPVGYRFSEFYLTRPVKAGEILDFYAGKPEFGRSSVTFRSKPGSAVSGRSAANAPSWQSVPTAGKKP